MRIFHLRYDSRRPSVGAERTVAQYTLLVGLCGVALACTDGGTAPGVKVAAVTVSGPATSVVAGATLQLSAVARNASGDPVPPSGATQWTSSAPHVAAVDQSGLVSGVAPGVANISARIDGVSGTYGVSVTGPSTYDVFTPGVVFSPTSLTVPVGATVNFYIYGDDHNVIFDKSVPGVPDDINIVRDVIVSRAFPVRGTFPYDCTVHPGMSGVVIVE
jgi:plastocyanin